MQPLDRQRLINDLSHLPPPQFEQLVFTLDVPRGILPAQTAPQGERASALLAWAENTGPGLRAVQDVLKAILGKQAPLLPAICPYKGLSYFDCNDEDYKYFYGREALTKKLLERFWQENFLAIVGASGSGKSSVLRAGLLQQLKDEGSYEIRVLVPGEHPLQSLALAFVDNAAERLERTEQLRIAETSIQEGPAGLRRLVQTAEAQRVVLVVDQFEEAFTLCKDRAERQAFFKTLLGALQAIPSKMSLILAMRADFVGRCFEEAYGGLAELVKTHLEPVLPMSQEELTQAITAPARQTGLSLEPGLVEVLLKDVDPASGSLPLLQYTLTELWKRQENNQLKVSTYIQLGGVTGTLQKRADEVYDVFTLPQQRTAKHIFISLTQLGEEETGDTRRRIPLDSLVSEQHPVLRVIEVVKQLADVNLVVTDERIIESGQRVATIDVTHEAIIRNWHKLQQWISENRDLLKQQRKIEQAAEEWNFQDHRPGYLLQGLPLLQAQKFRRDYSDTLSLSRVANDFIQTSLHQQRFNRFKLASWFFIPAVLVLGVTEYNLRELTIKRDYARLDRDGTLDEISAVINLTEGCHKKKQYARLANYLSERIFGNCRSLSGALLANSEFDNIDLFSVSLIGADLSNADLSDAHLKENSLIDANMKFADLNSIFLEKNLARNSQLNFAEIRYAFILENDFSFADLTGADLTGSEIVKTNFKYANLEQADLSSASIRDTDLQASNLNNAKLLNTIVLTTDLREVENLSESQFTGVNAPLVCNSPLPITLKIEGGQDRDCERIPNVLMKRYPQRFRTIEHAEAYVEVQRGKVWD